MLYMDNKATYRSKSVVDYYASRDGLFPAELAIVCEIEPWLIGGKVLDIGIGGGRTTVPLATLARKYVGVDYSEEMIVACRTRFAGHPLRDRMTFAVADARDMSMFGADEFDVVVFSFNGIDSVRHDDRMQILREIYRVLKPGGRFFFSTHNANCIDDLFAMHLSTNPRELARAVRKWVLLRVKNFGRDVTTCKLSGHAHIVDGGVGFRVENYYASPLTHLRQLWDVGFCRVRAFDLQGNPANLYDCTDCYIHYLCTNFCTK